MRYLGVGVVVASIAYSLLLYFVIRSGSVSSLQLLLSMLPLLLAGGWAAWRAVSPGWRPLVLASGLALVYGLFVGDYLRQGLIAADGVWHATMNAFMLLLFGRTLLPGRTPLISQVARILEQGELSRVTSDYTRKVTQAWSLFFMAQLLGSALLYLLAPVAIWSLFVNVLNAPLIALMFAAEYFVRLLFHPEQARNSIPQVIGAFSRQMTASRKD